MRTLRNISAHEIFCAPPGLLDLLEYKTTGRISKRLGMWVGTSIEKMVRSLA